MFDCTISNNTLSRSELSYEEGSILNIHYGDILIKYGSILDIHKYKIPRIPNKKKEDFKVVCYKLLFFSRFRKFEYYKFDLIICCSGIKKKYLSF